MKRVRNILASWSLMAFVVAFAVFSVCAFLGFYAALLWSGLTAFVAFCVLLIAWCLFSSKEMDSNYLNYCSR